LGLDAIFGILLSSKAHDLKGGGLHLVGGQEIIRLQRIIQFLCQPLVLESEGLKGVIYALEEPWGGVRAQEVKFG